MCFLSGLLAMGVLCLTLPDFLEASYQCGIRKHSFVQLVHRGWNVEEGQWPWHTAIFHRQQKSDSGEYACGGTLLDEKHVLTAAHCAVHRDTGYALPVASFKLHFGQQNLSTITENVQIRDVSKVHIHPEHSTHRNDIAILVLRLPVRYTDYVIPICLDQKADIDLRNLEGERGWITGWGTTHTGSLSEVLHTASLPVVSYLQCINEQESVFGNLLNQNVFCAGDRNGTSPGTGDSGGGMFFSDGDRWVLRGIISFAKMDELKNDVDTSKFVIFVNVQRFLSWIKEIVAENAPQSTRASKRISESECERFQGLSRKRKNNICDNSRYPHSVLLLNVDDAIVCNGVLVNENHVLTACHCNPRHSALSRVQVGTYRQYDISTVMCHPQYNSRFKYHDLAVIKLNTSVELSSNVIPACMASNWTENLYDTLLKTGLGVDTLTGIVEQSESEENYVITKERCEKSIPAIRRLPQGILPGQLCVNNTDPLGTTDDGSDGSPLQSVNTRSCTYTVVGILGITSSGAMGMGARRDDAVIDVYTRVAHYLDWIEQTIWDVETPMTSTPKVEIATIGKLAYQTDFVFPDDPLLSNRSISGK